MLKRLGTRGLSFGDMGLVSKVVESFPFRANQEAFVLCGRLVDEVPHSRKWREDG